MKNSIYIMAISVIAFLSACEKKDYPKGVPELEHHYYVVYVPNNNTGITVSRTQTDLVKFPVQFYSTFTREYDAVAKYVVSKTGITNPAVVGQDFNIVDKNGNVIPSADSVYSIVFPKAVQKTDTIYIKLLNSATPGQRKIEIQLMDNITEKFDVDIFSTAFRRPITIN